MKYSYKKIDISTVAGLKKAERLQAKGWKAISVGTRNVLLEKQN